MSLKIEDETKRGNVSIMIVSRALPDDDIVNPETRINLIGGAKEVGKLTGRYLRLTGFKAILFAGFNHHPLIMTDQDVVKVCQMLSEMLIQKLLKHQMTDSRSFFNRHWLLRNQPSVSSCEKAVQ